MAGRQDLRVQAYTGGIGHGNYTTDQHIAAIRAFDAWVRTGTAPSADAFPAEPGFVPGFLPPFWPQP